MASLVLGPSLSRSGWSETHLGSVTVGFLATPTCVLVLLHELHAPFEVVDASPIGYMAWCVFFVIDYVCVVLDLWTNLTRLVLGAHVTNLHRQRLLLILCALSASLPAAVIGYLAHYVLNERLSLECTAGVVSEVCIEDKCCFVVSSHDGNVANAIALFGLVLLIAWMIIKADPTLYGVASAPFE